MELSPKHVIVIKALGVKSQSGEAVRCPAGWYTLNAVSPIIDFGDATAGKRPNAASAGDIQVEAVPQGVRVTIPFAGAHACALILPERLHGIDSASLQDIGGFPRCRIPSVFSMMDT